MNKTINRSILIVIPKQPYYSWGNDLTPGQEPIDRFDECNSYLLDEDWDIAQAERFLRINFDEFFQELLFGMWTDESAWPQNRTWKIFGEWFDWHFSSMVWDVFPEKKVVWEEW